MSEKTSVLTPLMQQYFEIKKDYSDFLVFFQVGDFYELFFDDAKAVASFLAITLTKRGNINGDPIPLAGIPVHALEHYLIKLIKGGFKVVICDQLEEATPGKVVRRGVKQVLTPGTLTDSKHLNEKSASYILFASYMNSAFGLVFVEVMTGQIFATQINDEKNLDAELSRFFPDEIVVSERNSKLIPLFKKRGYAVTVFDEILNENSAFEYLKKLEKSEILLKDPLLQSAVCMYFYFQKHHERVLDNIDSVYSYSTDDFLQLDSATQRNLELVQNSQDSAKSNTLFSILDAAVTPMGSRMIKKWILRPLIKEESINARLDAVELFVKEILVKEKIILCLKSIGDIERIAGRIALSKAGLQDYVNLKNALEVFPALVETLKTYSGNYKILQSIVLKLHNFQNLKALLEVALNDDFSQSMIIKPKFDKRLDEIRDLVNTGHQKILELERSEIEVTKINSLKIRFNDVIGYYIEVTKSNADFVPENYKRIQTLANRERYITSDLKELELKIERAKKEVNSVEQELFLRIKTEVFSHISDLKKAAYVLSHLDALIGFAETAYQYNYTRPHFVKDFINIVDGRHPVVERNTECFIPNSAFINKESRMWIITGPNMGGKSTFLRQTALLSLMAQCGSFVPAKMAEFKVLDKIFTRIGAGDNLAEGKSTFLVEMEETSSICKNATANSLVILDEVGRGTSTYDGFAIAQAVIEYINKNIGSFCLFATHYHELTDLHGKLPGVVCYTATSKKTEGRILFLHKIEPGVAESSFGLEVAKLADLPEEIIARASGILSSINNKFKFLS